MEKNKSFNNTVWMFGALYAVLSILYMLINPVNFNTSKETSVGMGGLVLFVFIGIFILAVWYYRNQDNDVTLGKAVKLSVLIGLLGGVLVSIYTYVYFVYINPDLAEQTLEKVMEISRKTLEESGNYTKEEIAKQIEISKSLFRPIMVIAPIFGGLLYGVIGGLLGGLFFKTPNEDY